MKKLLLLFNTVKFLKPIQVYYRFYYVVRKRVRKFTGFHYPLSMVSRAIYLELAPSIPSPVSVENRTFTFLNLSYTFEEEGIEWNFSEYGKLWTYNLTYFDFLHQEEMCKEKGLGLIHDFIDKMETHQDALEPFPISLRGINWIKFLTRHQIREPKIDDSLYAQYSMLVDNLEYHLLGNHLLENGFSLLFGAYYFQDEVLYANAVEILQKELKEQILQDGGHFELSPMYHQLMLFRVLDCINLLKNNTWKKEALLELFVSKAEIMLGWLGNISYQNGDIPLFNDSANYIAPTTEALSQYAKGLHLSSQAVNLYASGYRKIVKEKYESVIDIGSIGAKYIPGHAHADTFNFELRINGKPFIVDSGLSTYETNQKRFYERSTKAHNTVEVSEENSSEVWGSFRVANRAEIIELKEEENCIEATHDGYKDRGILHTRCWCFEENLMRIEDRLSQRGKAVFRLHFHPAVSKKEIEEKIKYDDFCLGTYAYAQAFNKTEKAYVLEIAFEKNLKVEIEI